MHSRSVGNRKASASFEDAAAIVPSHQIGTFLTRRELFSFNDLQRKSADVSAEYGDKQRKTIRFRCLPRVVRSVRNSKGVADMAAGSGLSQITITS